MDKLTLTISEAVKVTGIGRCKLEELIHSNNTDFPYFKVGRKVLINYEMLRDWIDKISKEQRQL